MLWEEVVRSIQIGDHCWRGSAIIRLILVSSSHVLTMSRVSSLMLLYNVVGVSSPVHLDRCPLLEESAWIVFFLGVGANMVVPSLLTSKGPLYF